MDRPGWQEAAREISARISAANGNLTLGPVEFAASIPMPSLEGIDVKDLQSAHKKNRATARVRTVDDLELIKMIIEDDPPLFSKVVAVVETALGKRQRMDEERLPKR